MASPARTIARTLVRVNSSTKLTLCQQPARKYAVHTNTGAFLSEPQKVPLGVTTVTATVTTGLLVGAAISKNIASFLEENELFVPSDDDDDD